MKMKRKWTPTEIQALEKQLMRFILSGQVPGKKECEKCLKADPETFKGWDGKSVKYYAHS